MRRKPAARDRCGVRRVADDRDHLAETARLGAVDQPRQEKPAQSPALKFRRDIDRVLDAPPVRRPGVVRRHIGVAGDDSGPFGDEIRKILRQQPVQAPRHLSLRRRFDLKRRRAVGDGLAVDAGDGCDIAWTGGADISAAHRSCAPQKENAPG
jgi:hypothetical protein